MPYMPRAPECSEDLGLSWLSHANKRSTRECRLLFLRRASISLGAHLSDSTSNGNKPRLRLLFLSSCGTYLFNL